jgi:hypothetical protein
MGRRSSIVELVALLSLVTAPVLYPLEGQDAPPATEVQAPAPAPGAQPPAAVPADTAAAGPLLEVREVKTLATEDSTVAQLGDRVEITLQGLRGWLANSESRCESLVLFLDGIAIKGTEPDSCDPYSETVYFQLDRTHDSNEAWHVLLEEPLGFYREIQVSVGPEGSLAFPTRIKKFRLEILPKKAFFVYFVVLALMLVIGVQLARRTNLLRDREIIGLPPGQFAPYSLSRFQLAFWSFLVVAAYIFIWLVTEELDTITGSVLALLGIGAGTALGARLIDSGTPANAPPAPVAAPGTGGAEGTAPAAVPAPARPNKPAVSQGFVRDILADEQGISLHRLQLFVWTLVLGVIFVADVYNRLTMPQFSTTLLGLMGLSSGTYLGFKVPETRAEPEAPAPREP